MHDKANILADNWEPIFNGVAQAKESIEEYVGRLAQRWNRVDLQDIDADITEEEVMLAINRCKAGKTCGPDDLGNEWYKDNAERLVPILTQLFNSCMKDGRTPHSFLEAFIFSVSKGGDRSNPLNYRPIALLNTDYKIFTRILAWRVRKHISKLVHETQCGFVPGKTIHEVIDLFEAAKAVCREGKRLTKAQVLLLDFAKAYDSLDRDFLLTVLQKKGFPERFCKIVATIHAGTTVKFMANGQLSRALNITSGIRQGCPLAPLLFILAVDLLYDEVDMDAGLVGIALDSKSPERQLKAAGYADDTAIYIADKSMQATAIAAVARFSAASGLQLNVGKSAAISLGRGSADTESPEDIDWAENGDGVGEGHNEIAEIETTRYLGHIAGNVDTVKQAWTAAFKALTIRLELAQVKTNTVQQRAAIAAAIIVPKLMFVARHAWPSEDLAKEANWRIRNFVWKASFALPERAP
ncbi:hypothetical protein PR001_g23257 [Phytophthora rubi]|uniref:Reverse transcriptase domain-containing protein n=1 Tax=Phytophthora rubi TaxID=129364 RepID=A0A6A3IUU8_9STRA|nr:hypothetical protein PR001_g23257 [Phytophthora rubi]